MQEALRDPVTENCRAGLDLEWQALTEYLTRIARRTRDYNRAVALAESSVTYCRGEIAAFADVPSEALDDLQVNQLRNLAVSLQGLAAIRGEIGEARVALASLEEALAVCRRAGDRRLEASLETDRGIALIEDGGEGATTRAEEAFTRALALLPKNDPTRHTALGRLGGVALQRFREGVNNQQPPEELLLHLNAALAARLEALRVVPKYDSRELARIHTEVADVYSCAGDADKARPHLLECLHHAEVAGDTLFAAQTRFNMALTLARAERYAEALDYAQASEKGFAQLGSVADREIGETRRLIRQLEASARSARDKPGGP
jgi:tetratricopeptide (TPR) repeat protein